MEGKFELAVSPETAALAKQKGFDWPCREVYNSNKVYDTLTYYEGDGSGWITNSGIKDGFFSDDLRGKAVTICTAPTQAHLQRWLRQEHKIEVWAQPFVGIDGLDETYSYFIYDNKFWVDDSTDFETFEIAFEMGLQRALEQINI